MPKQPLTLTQWLCVAYLVLAGLVFIANIVVHLIGPW